MGLGLWKSSGGGNVTPLSIAGSALIVDYDPAYEYALNSGNLSALGNNASAATTYDLTTAAAGNQPPYNTVDATANNRPTIGNFDGSADCLRNLTANPIAGRTQCTAFLVAQINPVIGQLIISGASTPMAIQVLSNTMYVYSSGSNYGQLTYSSTAWVIVELVYDGTQTGNANRLKLFINGTQQTLTFSGTIPAILAASTTFFMGALNDAAAVPFAGKIAQYLVVNSADTVDVNPRMRRYLGAKFGITVV